MPAAEIGSAAARRCEGRLQCVWRRDSPRQGRGRPSPHMGKNRTGCCEGIVIPSARVWREESAFVLSQSPPDADSLLRSERHRLLVITFCETQIEVYGYTLVRTQDSALQPQAAVPMLATCQRPVCMPSGHFPSALMKTLDVHDCRHLRLPTQDWPSEWRDCRFEAASAGQAVCARTCAAALIASGDRLGWSHSNDHDVRKENTGHRIPTYVRYFVLDSAARYSTFWTSKYGSVVSSGSGLAIADGMNEKGTGAERKLQTHGAESSSLLCSAARREQVTLIAPSGSGSTNWKP